MKTAREKACGEEIRAGTGTLRGAGGLLAIGPDIVCAGEIIHVTDTSWILRLNHFVAGDVHTLISFIDGFIKRAAEDRYVLSNEVGDGRVLLQAPALAMEAGRYILTCPVAPSLARVDAQKLGSSIALHQETEDLYLDSNGSIVRVSGVDVLPQNIKTLFSMQRGESAFAATSGMRFFEYFADFSGTPWLDQLLTLDVVRQAAVPMADRLMNTQLTPLQCVTRVHGVELLSESPENNRIRLRVDFDVQGIGRWRQELSVYMPTKKQMQERAKLVQKTQRSISNSVTK
jgi:hypothetical protein